MPKAGFLPSSWRRHGLLALGAVFILVIDQLAKLWVETSLSVGDSSSAIGPLTIVRVNNQYGVWGLRGPQALWLFVSFVAIAVMFFLYSREFFSSHRRAALALGLILGGTVGNLIDRLSSGYVTDFIQVHLWGDVYWPAFNIADMAIVIGACLAVYTLLLSRKPT